MKSVLCVFDSECGADILAERVLWYRGKVLDSGLSLAQVWPMSGWSNPCQTIVSSSQGCPCRSRGHCGLLAAGQASARVSGLLSEGSGSQRGDPAALAASVEERELML